MKKLLLVLVMMVGCETPVGRLVEAEPAIDQILISYSFVSRGSKPEVFLVEDAHCDGGPSFWRPDNGRCVRGMFAPELFGPGNIYLADPGTNLFHNTSLAHEVLHYLGFDHPSDGNWAPDSPEKRCIAKANKILAGIPSADAIDW